MYLLVVLHHDYGEIDNCLIIFMQVCGLEKIILKGTKIYLLQNYSFTKSKSK